MVCSHLVERIHERLQLVFPGCVHCEFGSSPKNFKKVEFENFVNQFSKDHANQIKSGGAYMPCAIKKEYLIKAGKYPEGNLAGSNFGEIIEYGDQRLTSRLKDMGVEHITALDSLVYHFKEGEMDEVQETI
jgi:predicted esterase YcpF (UPF0227 family)